MISNIEAFTFYSIIRCLLLPKSLLIISIPFIEHNLKQKSRKNNENKSIRQQITIGKRKINYFRRRIKNRVAPFVRLLKHRLLKHLLLKHQLLALKHRLLKRSIVKNIDWIKHRLDKTSTR